MHDSQHAGRWGSGCLQADAELSNPGIDFKRVIGLYLDASDYFLKDRCFQMPDVLVAMDQRPIP